ncbi:MAG TPA: ATP-binding protein, partial [Gemmatimonadales bacterium]|nr:ATP-binding protein [Gemmatimonadales bacterium]
AAPIPAPSRDESVVVLVEDVTDQQAMESHLIQSEKLAAVGQLVSGVAHELNNPLTSIAGLSEFLLEQKELGTKDRGHLRVIHEQAERAGRIVRNLLTFARKGPAERAPVDLNEVIQRTLLLMSYDLTLKDVTVETELAPVPPVLGERDALQQVVLNLLNNAAQAVGDNPPERPRTIRLATWFDDRVRMRVADTGPGIADDVMPHLFTPFFTTKEPGQGTGLGLSITYSIVEAHAGRITVERPSAGGAAFLVDLPAARGEVAAPKTAVRETVVPPLGVKRVILLVDDDPAVRRMVTALFGREGHTVEVARNAQHGLDLAGTRTYDLILADAQVRARDHLFVAQLVEAHPALKERVLVASGEGRSGTDDVLARLGLRYVRKPFNLRDLLDEAARVWAAATLS